MLKLAIFLSLALAHAQGCQNDLVDKINQARPSWNQVICDDNLEWLAYQHVKDQTEWYDAHENGATLYTDQCDLHSWKYKGGSCCHYNVNGDFRNQECMWNSHERLAGWRHPKGDVYEVSVGFEKKGQYDNDLT